MNTFRNYIFAAAILFLLPGVFCHAQNAEEEPDYDEMIAKQVDSMVSRYDLDDYQTFRLDTLLQHYIPIYNEQVRKIKAAGASQLASYQPTLDFWAEFLDSEYEKIFNEKQWSNYLKSYAGKERKKRQKRMAEAAQAKEKENR